MKKRLLALLLCLVMVIGLVPVALAGGEGAAVPEVKTVKTTLHFCYLGGGTNTTQDLAVGDHATKPANPSKPGYTWDGNWWIYGESAPANTVTSADAEDSWNFEAYTISDSARRDVYLFPGYSPIHYTIRFDGNGGSGSMEDLGRTYDVDVTLPQNSFTLEGHHFTGWKIDGTTMLIPDQCTLGNLTFTDNAIVTLTAQWEADEQPKPLRKITYIDAGKGTMDDYVDNGDFIYIDPNGGTAKLGNTDINKAGLHKIESDVTLTAPKGSLGWKLDISAERHKFTAVWPSSKYTVSFYCYNHGNDYINNVPYGTKLIIDPNYGTYAGSTARTEITVTSDITIKDASRYGYSFDGWYVTKDSAGVYTFTAVWDNNYYYNTYSIYYYDYDDCKSEYANFPYGTSVVIDPNGGTAKLSGTSFSTKQSFNIYRDYTLTDASRSGYTFYGWDLTKSGSTYYFTAMWSRYKSDVPYMLNGTDHYAYIKGYPNGSFKPTDTITRAEAATIFYRLLTDSTRKAYATTYNSFKDVPATAWYNTAVSTMAKLGIVNGGADGYFRPNDPITRAEIAAMIARCDGAYYTGTSTVFSDTYGHWAASYIARAYELGWINGYGTTYAPDRYISRAETVAVLNRVLNRAPQYTSDLTRNYTTFSDVATSAWYYLDVEEAANSHTYTRKSNADYETWTKLIADPSWF